MPCTLGGAPATIDMLFGLVNVGIAARVTRRCEYQAVASPGRRTVKTEPLPGSLVTVTSPPIMRASLRVIASRKPSVAEALRGRGIGLAELLERLCLLLRRHAIAGIGHHCQLDTRPNPSGWRS